MPMSDLPTDDHSSPIIASCEERLLHLTLVFTNSLSAVHPLLLIPLWVGLAALAGWPWRGHGLAVFGLALALTTADALSLALLPRLGRSYGPVLPPLLALGIVRTTLWMAVGLLWPTKLGLVATAVVHLAILALSIYATWIEPFRLQTVHATRRSPKLGNPKPLRLLHLSDLHVERMTDRERRLIAEVAVLEPDLLVLTGDYLNLSYITDAEAQRQAHDFLSELCDASGCPVYAITGSPAVDRAEVIPAIFTDLPITWLDDQVTTLRIGTHTIQLAGLRCTRERTLDGPRLRCLLGPRMGPDAPFTLLLYHSPDLMPEAVALGVDLYLCGHTHGGQIRLPFFGAIITSSDFWKQYEMGRYNEAGTTLYVSRGLGMEGLGAPRARFLAPPEITLWTLSR